MQAAIVVQQHFRAHRVRKSLSKPADAAPQASIMQASDVQLCSSPDLSNDESHMTDAGVHIPPMRMHELQHQVWGLFGCTLAAIA